MLDAIVFGVQPRTSIWGVDFSGAQDAGVHIWTCKAISCGAKLVLNSCRHLTRTHLVPSLGELVESVASSGPTIIGLDFPFGLPRSLVKKPSWHEMVTSFGDTYASADEFKAKLTMLAGGFELRRVTDRVARTPFSPYNLRMYKQTFHGIRDVLVPLLKSVSVLPMQAPAADQPWLVEICPRSTRKANGQAYAPTHDVIDWLRNAGVEIPKDIEESIIRDDRGDALDSAIAAFAAWRAATTIATKPLPGFEVVEGFVFV